MNTGVGWGKLGWVNKVFPFFAYFKVSDQFRILEAKNTANGIFSFLLFLHTSDLLLPAEINVVISDVGSDNAWSQCTTLVSTMLNKSCETDAQCRSRTDNSVCLQVERLPRGNWTLTTICVSGDPHYLLLSVQGRIPASDPARLHPLCSRWLFTFLF